MVFGKAPTTSYDLSKGFMQALRETVVSLDISLEDLLESTDMVRYSTTLAVNRLDRKKRSAPRAVHHRGFRGYAVGGQGRVVGRRHSHLGQMRNLPRMKKPEPVILRHMIVGVKERMDYSGKIVRPLDEEDTLAKLRYLVNQGAQGFVVCLINSYANPAHEQKIRELIRRQYPGMLPGKPDRGAVI